MLVKDLTDMEFGRLRVVERNGSDRNGQAMWLCECKCGNTVVVSGGHLRSGHTKSCGCFAKEAQLASHRTHGQRHTRLYRIWANMKGRCLNPNVKEYKWYGGKGISVYPEWLDFQSFYDWAMGNGYTDELTIDRIDSDGDYCPDNCQWITLAAQQSNRSNNRHLTYCGETHTIKVWAEKFGIEYFRFYGLLKKHNFDIGRMIECNELT